MQVGPCATYRVSGSKSRSRMIRPSGTPPASLGFLDQEETRSSQCVRLNLDMLGDDLEALGLGEPGDGGALSGAPRARHKGAAANRESRFAIVMPLCGGILQEVNGGNGGTVGN